MSATLQPQQSAMQFRHATKDSAPIVPGRRSFVKYRDLGVADGTKGAMRAQIMAVKTGMTEPTGWHYHLCEAQFIYALKGWVDLEFETGQALRLNTGDSMLIPGGMRHNEMRTSDDLELLEVTLPADMGTVPCEGPAMPSSTE
jgi:quercetin dioxygenase-like cupin family protein